MSAKHLLSGVQFRVDHVEDEDAEGFAGDVFAEHKGREVGRLSYESDYTGSKALVQGLHVDPEYRRQGIASRMYEVGHEQGHGTKYLHDTISMSPEGRAAASAHERKHPHMHDWE